MVISDGVGAAISRLFIMHSIASGPSDSPIHHMNDDDVVARSSAGPRRGQVVSDWDGWDNVGKHKPDSISAAPRVTMYEALALDVDTRWASLLKMLDSFMNTGAAILNVMQENPEEFREYTEPLPSANDIKHIKGVIEVLRPFEHATDLFGGENYCSLALVIDTVDQCRYLLLPNPDDNFYMRTFREKMRECFEFKFEPLFRTCNLANMAAFIHPIYAHRLLTRKYVDGDVLAKIQRAIANEAFHLAKKEAVEPSSSIFFLTVTSSFALSKSDAVLLADEAGSTASFFAK